jgi:hypothetical protein
MTDTMLKQMIADAKLCNARLKKVMGNVPPNSMSVEENKAAAARGGANSHKFGSKRNKNGIQGLQHEKS